MAGILKSRVANYEFSLQQMEELIANDLGCSVNEIKVEYVIQEVGGDPMDRYGGTDTVTKIRVTKTEL